MGLTAAPSALGGGETVPGQAGDELLVSGSCWAALSCWIQAEEMLTSPASQVTGRVAFPAGRWLCKEILCSRLCLLPALPGDMEVALGSAVQLVLLSHTHRGCSAQWCLLAAQSVCLSDSGILQADKASY